MKNVAKLVLTASVSGLFALAAPASAAPLVYNIDLTGSFFSNPKSGTGSFTIDDSTFQGVGNEFFSYSGSANVLLGLTLNIDGYTFDRSNSLGADEVFFQNGVFSGLTYQGLAGQFRVSLNAGALSYVYSNGINGHASLGSISASGASAAPVTSAVPEPATWAMMMLGVGVVGASMRRRKVNTTVSYA